MECVTCVCVWLGAGGVEGEWIDRIGFGLYQFWWNMGKVGYVSVFWLRWCGCYWGKVGGYVSTPPSQGLGGWSGVMSVCVVSLDSLS